MLKVPFLVVLFDDDDVDFDDDIVLGELFGCLTAGFSVVFGEFY